MKNANYIETIVKCYKCNQGGFFCTTPLGGDYQTCPLCGEMNCNDILTTVEEENALEAKLKELGYNQSIVDFYLGYEFCNQCKIIFEIGCTHAVQGCTDDVRNGHLIKRWKYLPTGFIYDGMPQFENLDECKTNLDQIEILELICLNNNIRCTNEYHKHMPGHYYECDVAKNKPVPSYVAKYEPLSIKYSF
jgi:hypothetical protein